ncbi:MAG: hypothetical protein ACOYOU_08135 [Kiritimatiellia bacterium]
MRKDRTDSPLTPLTEAQQDELFVTLQHLPYGKGVEWVQEHFAIATSVGSLARWWKRQSSRRLRDEVRRGIQASKSYDVAVDESVLDTRMAKALKENFFALTARGDPDAALDFATLALKANKGKQDAERLQRLMASERERDELKLRVAELERLLDVTKQAATPKVDSAQVAKELDAQLGRKS